MAARLSRRTKIVAGFAAFAVLAGAFLAYQVTRRGDPSFRRGGDFASGLAAPGSTTTTGATAPEETTTTLAEATTSSTAAAAAAATTTSRPRTTTSRAGAATPGTTATTRAAASPAPASTPATAPVPAPAQPGTAPAGPALPALGTYVYAVDGTEGASVMGTRRFPSEMTMTAHGAPDLTPDQVVFDLRYSSEHEEREIVGFRGDGVYFDFEGGSVSFGPRTETSEADYDPPMLQIPQPLAAGVSRSGTSAAKKADGSVGRTETWKVAVLGQEAVVVGGAPVQTWKVQVERRFAGSGEQGTRNRTYWFDPARNLWVKFTEVFHGERRTGGFSFTYDSNLTATLSRFTPA